MASYTIKKLGLKVKNIDMGASFIRINPGATGCLISGKKFLHKRNSAINLPLKRIMRLSDFGPVAIKILELYIYSQAHGRGWWEQD